MAVNGLSRCFAAALRIRNDFSAYGFAGYFHIDGKKDESDSGSSIKMKGIFWVRQFRKGKNLKLLCGFDNGELKSVVWRQ
jgi:hypothetical protein